jgi:hypothetical protein
MADGGEVGGAITLSDATFVFAADDIEDPMKAVLDAPMLACGAGELYGVGGDRGDAAAGLAGSPACPAVRARPRSMLMRSGHSGWRWRSQAMSLVIQWRRVSIRPWSASVV